jgi:hypothetical protein
MMRSPHVIWASVSIVFMLVAGSVTLVILDKDVSIILTLAGIVAVPVLGGFGVAVYQKLDQVKEQVNGNSEKDRVTIKELQDTIKDLALRLPPPGETIKEVLPVILEAKEKLTDR